MKAMIKFHIQKFLDQILVHLHPLQDISYKYAKQVTF
jgi:hypothetical protein